MQLLMNLDLGLPSLFAQAVSPTPSAIEKWTETNPVPTTIIATAAIIGVTAIATVYSWKPPRVTPPSNDEGFRHIVAKTVLFSAIWGTVTVAGLAILVPSTNTRDILSLLLPVFGTWVGTLLAYYFGKDNYESGARNSASLARALTGMEKLRAIPVTQAGIMIPVDKIDLPAAVKGKKVADYASILLQDVRLQMKRQRLPLISERGYAYAVVHKSLIDDFLLKDPANAATAKLADLIGDATAGKVAKESFVVLADTVTLADVKARMEQQSRSSGVSCEDAFITPAGSDKVVGWITNDIINSNALPYTSDGRPA